MDEPLLRLLRVHREPHRYITELEVHEALTASPSEYMGFFRRELSAIAHGAAEVEMPSKQIFLDPSGGDFRVMPCVVNRRGVRRKTVKIVGTNTVGRTVPDQVTVGKAFRLDAEENYVTEVIEACLLSSARTGACAALAVELLHGGVRRVDIVGAGRVGYYSALYASLLGQLEEVVFHDVDQERARSMAKVEPGGLASRAGTAEDLTSAEVVILATTATLPVLAPGPVPPLVVSLGADTVHQRELPPTYAAAEVYTDGADSFEVGDLRAWAREGLIDPTGVTTLLELFRSPPPAPRPSPRVFVSTGSALFDNVTIGYLLDGR